MPLSSTTQATSAANLASTSVTNTTTTAAGSANVSPNGTNSNGNYEYTTTNIPAFLSKLWTLVEDPKYDQLIAWDPSGFSFHVYDQTRFAKEILPRFFKHNNMASFIRQLNMYGFRKVNSIDHGSLKNEKEDLEFHHPYFIKGKEQFLEFIKRKVSDLKTNSVGAITTTNVVAQTSNNQAALQYSGIKEDELNKVLDDVNTIKSKQKIVDDSLMSVKKENEVLWKEIATLRQKHHHQQQIVNKLIHFLVHLVNPSSLGLKRSRPLMIDGYSNLSDEDAGGEINEIDDEDEEDFLSNNQITLKKLKNVNNTNNIAVDLIDHIQPPTKKIRTADSSQHMDGSSMYALPAAKIASDLKTITLDNNKLIKHTQYQVNSPDTVQLSGNKSHQRSAVDASPYMNQNQGVVINEIVDSPAPPTINFDAKVRATNKQLMSNNGDFIDANLFLNTNQASSNQDGPIITTPASPLEDSNKSHVNNGKSQLNYVTPLPNSMNQQQQQPQAQPQLQQQQPQHQQQHHSPIATENGLNISPLNPNNNSIQALDIGLTDPIGDEHKKTYSLKNNSSNQMVDHVESLQLDLNSIKEYLTSNSFNQIDPYTINNLFSPSELEPIDNEPFYLEPPLASPINNDKLLKSSIDILGSIPTANNFTASLNESNAGKIIGNELIQIEPNDLLINLDPVTTTTKDRSSKNSELTTSSGKPIVSSSLSTDSSDANLNEVLDSVLLDTPCINSNNNTNNDDHDQANQK